MEDREVIRAIRKVMHMYGLLGNYDSGVMEKFWYLDVPREVAKCISFEAAVSYVSLQLTAHNYTPQREPENFM